MIQKPNVTMKENVKKEYDAPKVEMLEARVEQGFQPSGSPVGSPLTEDDPINGDALFS